MNKECIAATLLLQRSGYYFPVAMRLSVCVTVRATKMKNH